MAWVHFVLRRVVARFTYLTAARCEANTRPRHMHIHTDPRNIQKLNFSVFSCILLAWLQIYQPAEGVAAASDAAVRRQQWLAAAPSRRLAGWSGITSSPERLANHLSFGSWCGRVTLFRFAAPHTGTGCASGGHMRCRR